MKNVVTRLMKRLFKNLFNSCMQYFYVETLCKTIEEGKIREASVDRGIPWWKW
jgi:hypothetical protein